MSGQPKTIQIGKRQSIVRYIRQGKRRAEIAQLVGCSPGMVDRVTEAITGNTPRTVRAYVCQGCDAAGVYFRTVYKPCVLCLARGGE